MTALETSTDAETLAILDRNPDLAAEVLLKEDLLCEGVDFSESRDAYQDDWCRLRFHGGDLQLLPTIVRPPSRPGSRYVLRHDPSSGTGALVVRPSGVVLADASPYPARPAYLLRQFADGRSFGDAVSPDGVAHVVTDCPGESPEGCGWCTAQGVVAQTSTAGRTRVHVLSPEAIGTAVFAAYALEHWPLQHAPGQLLFDGGDGASSYEGTAEEDFFLPYVQAVAHRLHASVHIALRLEPKPIDVERRFAEAGVTVRILPLGSWDPQVIEGAHPHLGRNLDRDTRIRRILDAVEVYGDGGVLTDMQVGSEFAVDRFANRAEAVASLRSGFRFLAAHGCVPRLSHWHGEVGTGLAPDRDFYLDADRVWYEAWVEMQTPEPRSWIMGVGRNRHPDSAAWDVGRGGPPEYAREWNAEKLGPPGVRVPSMRKGVA